MGSCQTNAYGKNANENYEKIKTEKNLIQTEGTKK